MFNFEAINRNKKKIRRAGKIESNRNKKFQW